MRSVRRAVHTLKGDSAACGFYQLSELAHEFEDVLSPQIGLVRRRRASPKLCWKPRTTFGAMLSAYQRDIEPPPADALA